MLDLLVPSSGVGPVWLQVYHSKLSCWKGGSQLRLAQDSPDGSFLTRFSQSDHDHNFLRDWVSELSSASHHYLRHSHTIWVNGCGIPPPDREAASSLRTLANWLGPWLCNRTPRSLHCRQCRSDEGPRFRLHGAWPDAQIIILPLEAIGVFWQLF